VSYEEEFSNLKEWWRQKVDEHLALYDKERAEGTNKGNLDSPLDVIGQRNYIEFKRRLAALDEKYGVK
jgi:hypothetical protein